MGVAEVSLLRIYNICVQQPASKAILRRSARSIPLFRTVFVNAGGQHRAHLARNPSPAYAKSGRDRFDSWHFVRPFGLPSVEMWRGFPNHQPREFSIREARGGVFVRIQYHRTLLSPIQP